MVIYERLGTCPKYRTRRANLTFFLVVALAPPRTSAWAPPNLLSINMVLPPSIRSPELNRFQRSSSRGNRRSRDTTCWAVNSCITWVMRPPSIHDRATEEQHRNQRSRSIPALSMKVKSRKGGRGSRGGSTATASRSPKGRKSLLIEVQDMASDAWKLEEAVDILRDGGVGVIPTDTCYTFACDLHSRRGVERILQIKNEQGRHKPLTLLCKDISTMNLYARGIDKGLFKTMKAILPGPYTFILPSTNEVPRMLREHKHHKKTWKRKEIGIRLPDAPILLHLLAKLDRPLICGSVPAALSSKGSEEEKEEGEDESDRERAREAWREDKMVSGDPYAIDRTFGHAVDFVVDAGVLEVGGYSTIVDAVGAEPVVLREGIGNPFLVMSN